MASGAHPRVVGGIRVLVCTCLGNGGGQCCFPLGGGLPAGSPHAGIVGLRGLLLPEGPVGQPQKCGVIPLGACGRGGMLRGIVGIVLV